MFAGHSQRSVRLLYGGRLPIIDVEAAPPTTSALFPPNKNIVITPNLREKKLILCVKSWKATSSANIAAPVVSCLLEVVSRKSGSPNISYISISVYPMRTGCVAHFSLLSFSFLFIPFLSPSDSAPKVIKHEYSSKASNKWLWGEHRADENLLSLTHPVQMAWRLPFGVPHSTGTAWVHTHMHAMPIRFGRLHAIQATQKSCPFWLLLLLLLAPIFCFNFRAAGNWK